ncbi:hypothetical protein Taro_014170, partial [Colocasia esculenta]|nr:hypothetical protein [Colocasia esculenta]
MEIRLAPPIWFLLTLLTKEGSVHHRL